MSYKYNNGNFRDCYKEDVKRFDGVNLWGFEKNMNKVSVFDLRYVIL